jgi:hypothetical protein
MSEHRCVEMVMQKDGADCGVASLAMLLGKGYSDVRAMCQKNVGDIGMTNAQIHSAARKLGRKLKYHRGNKTFKLGIIKLERAVHDRPRTKEYHVAVFFYGVILNPADGLVWEPEALFAARRWKPIGIFVDVTPMEGA